MLLERAEIQVKSGMENDFAEALSTRGLALLGGQEGVRWANLGRGIESPRKFLLLVAWESLEAHAAYQASAARQEFLKLIGAYVEGGAMEHFRMLQGLTVEPAVPPR